MSSGQLRCSSILPWLDLCNSTARNVFAPCRLYFLGGNTVHAVLRTHVACRNDAAPGLALVRQCDAQVHLRGTETDNAEVNPRRSISPSHSGATLSALVNVEEHPRVSRSSCAVSIHPVNAFSTPGISFCSGCMYRTHASSAPARGTKS